MPGIPGQDYPTLDFFNLPSTGFECQGRVNGGWALTLTTLATLCLTLYCRFYSDEEAFCQMYHMCVAEASGTFKKFSFLCPNGSFLQPPCNLIELLKLWRYNLQPGEAGVWRLVQCRLFRGHHRQRRLRPRPARRWENLHHSRVGVWRAGEGLPVEIQKWLVLRCQMKEKDLEMKQLFKIKLQISSYHKLLDTENSIVIQSEM